MQLYVLGVTQLNIDGTPVMNAATNLPNKTTPSPTSSKLHRRLTGFSGASGHRIQVS